MGYGKGLQILISGAATEIDQPVHRTHHEAAADKVPQGGNDDIVEGATHGQLRICGSRIEPERSPEFSTGPGLDDQGVRQQVEVGDRVLEPGANEGRNRRHDDHQRAFFRRGLTRDIGFRVRQLGVLRSAIVRREGDILRALKQDLDRPTAEGYTSEIGIALHEINFALKNVASWANPRKVRTPLMLFPGSRLR